MFLFNSISIYLQTLYIYTAPCYHMTCLLIQLFSLLFSTYIVYLKRQEGPLKLKNANKIKIHNYRQGNLMLKPTILETLRIERCNLRRALLCY